MGAPLHLIIAQNLRACREVQGLSTQDLASLSGLSAGVVSLAETGNPGLTIMAFSRMATALGVNPQFLMTSGAFNHERSSG